VREKSESVIYSSMQDQDQLVNSSQTMCVEYNFASDFVYLPPPPPQPSSSSSRINLHHLNLKSEADRRKTWNMACDLRGPNKPAAAGFYLKNWSDLVLCAFCGVKVARLEEGDNVLKELQRWNNPAGPLRGCALETFLFFQNDQPET